MQLLVRIWLNKTQGIFIYQKVKWKSEKWNLQHSIEMGLDLIKYLMCA